MAKGWDKTQQATQAAAQARERAEQSRLPQLFTTAVKASKGGAPVIVRFLEQGPDINSYDRHEYQVPDGRGGFYRRQFTCLRESPWNNPVCPGCQAGLKIKLRGVYNIIQRDRAVLRRGQDNRPIKGPDNKPIVDGHEDQVVILDVPSTTAEALRQKDADYHGLMGLDLRLSDSGSTFQPWNVEPADIMQPLKPMTDADMALAAAKHDLDAFMKPPTFEEAQQIVSQYGANSGASGQPQQSYQQPAAPAPSQVPANVGQGGAFAGAQAAVAPPAAVPQAQPVPQAAPAPVPTPQAQPVAPGAIPMIHDQQAAPVPTPAETPAPVPAPVPQPAVPTPAAVPQQ